MLCCSRQPPPPPVPHIHNKGVPNKKNKLCRHTVEWWCGGGWGVIFAVLSREADANLLAVTKSKRINPAALCCSAVTRSRRHSGEKEKEKSREPREPHIFTTKADFFFNFWVVREGIQTNIPPSYRRLTSSCSFSPNNKMPSVSSCPLPGKRTSALK